MLQICFANHSVPYTKGTCHFNWETGRSPALVFSTSSSLFHQLMLWPSSSAQPHLNLQLTTTFNVKIWFAVIDRGSETALQLLTSLQLSETVTKYHRLDVQDVNKDQLRDILLWRNLEEQIAYSFWTDAALWTIIMAPLISCSDLTEMIFKVNRPICFPRFWVPLVFM